MTAPCLYVAIWPLRLMQIASLHSKLLLRVLLRISFSRRSRRILRSQQDGRVIAKVSRYKIWIWRGPDSFTFRIMQYAFLAEGFYPLGRFQTQVRLFRGARVYGLSHWAQSFWMCQMLQLQRMATWLVGQWACRSISWSTLDSDNMFQGSWQLAKRYF